MTTTNKQYFGTVEQQQIDKLKDLEKEYQDVIYKLQASGIQGNYSLIKEVERKMYQIQVKRLGLEADQVDKTGRI